MKSIDLEYFRRPLDWLDEDFGPMLTKAAVYCFEDQGHRPGTQIEFYSDPTEDHWVVEWSTSLDPVKAATLPNENELTQKGSECVSLLVAAQMTGLEYFETAQIGSGVDFWLKEDPYAMIFDAGLEVSGIRKEAGQNTISKRALEKAEQARKQEHVEINVYISVVEFSIPKVNFMKL